MTSPPHGSCLAQGSASGTTTPYSTRATRTAPHQAPQRLWRQKCHPYTPKIFCDSAALRSAQKAGGNLSLLLPSEHQEQRFESCRVCSGQTSAHISAEKCPKSTRCLALLPEAPQSPAWFAACEHLCSASASPERRGNTSTASAQRADTAPHTQQRTDAASTGDRWKLFILPQIHKSACPHLPPFPHLSTYFHPPLKLLSLLVRLCLAEAPQPFCVGKCPPRTLQKQT